MDQAPLANHSMAAGSSPLAPMPVKLNVFERAGAIGSLMQGGYAIVVLLLLLIGWGVRTEMRLAQHEWQETQRTEQRQTDQQRLDRIEKDVNEIKVGIGSITENVKFLAGGR